MLTQQTSYYWQIATKMCNYVCLFKHSFSITHVVVHDESLDSESIYVTNIATVHMLTADGGREGGREGGSKGERDGLNDISCNSQALHIFVFITHLEVIFEIDTTIC